MRDERLSMAWWDRMDEPKPYGLVFLALAGVLLGFMVYYGFITMMFFISLSFLIIVIAGLLYGRKALCFALFLGILQILLTILGSGTITFESLFSAGIFCLVGFFVGTIVEQKRHFWNENQLSNEKFQKYDEEKKTFTTELEATQLARDTAIKKFNFLSGITHNDIFNNLSALIGSIDLMKTKISDPELRLDIDRSENIAYIIRHQIDFAKTYGKIGTSEPQWLNVAKQIHALQSSVPLNEIDITISFEGLEIFVDPLFEIIFANLINNSLTFGVRVSKISISYIPFNDDIAIVYEDNGIGIHAVDKSKIFEKGVGKNPGFGLYLSREILSVTGLSIKECGVYGEGARFEIFVPEGKFRFV